MKMTKSECLSGWPSDPPDLSDILIHWRDFYLFYISPPSFKFTTFLSILLWFWYIVSQKKKMPMSRIAAAAALWWGCWGLGWGGGGWGWGGTLAVWRQAGRRGKWERGGLMSVYFYFPLNFTHCWVSLLTGRLRGDTGRPLRRSQCM